MQLNRVSAPNEGAAGMDVTNDAAVNGAATEARAAIAMVRTQDVKVWRGRELGDKARLRIAPPPGKVISQPIKGGWFSRIRQALQARSQRVQEQSAQRLAALNPEQSTAPQSGPQWLRGLGTFRGRLKSLIIKLKERAMPRAPLARAAHAPSVMQTVKAAARAAAAAAASNTASSTAKDSSVYRTVKTPDPNAGTDASSAADNAALAQATAAVQQRFAAQAADKEAFTELLQKAFGDKFDAAKAETIRQQALAGDFSWAPKVQVVDSKTLNDLSGTQAAGSAKGAYVQETDTIYISRELLHSDPQEAQQLLMEEMGHGIDARINTSDAVGDEGEIFAKLMHGDNISAQEMQALKADNDHGVVNINGKNVTVEYGWFKKLKKAVTGGIKKVVKGVVKGAINLAKSAVKVGVGLVTFDFKKVKEGVKEGANAVKTAVKTVAKAIKETASEIHKISKEAFKKLMQSKIFAAVLTICRFIPIPIVALVVRIIDVVRAAYMVYQGIKNKSLSMVLGGVASLASGGANLAGSLGASAATVNTIKTVADAASKVSMAYNAVANKDIGAAMGLLGGVVGGPTASPAMNTLVTVGGYAQQAVSIGQAIKSKDALGALGGIVGAASSYNGDNKSELGQQLASAQEVITGARAIREISRGNLDAAHSLASSMTSAKEASQQADAISAQRRADEEAAANAAQQAANNRSLLNEADKDLRSLPAEQEGAPAAANDNSTAAEEHRNGSDVDSDNTAARNGGVGPSSSQTLLTVGKGQTLEGIARAQYGENWKAGLTQMMLDNNIKLNQWGSPILGVGKTLVLNDIGGKSEAELASLSRTGGRIISNNHKGLQAKADIEERAREAAAQKAQEAQHFSASIDSSTAGECTPSNPQGLSQSQLQAEAAMYARLGLRSPATGPVGSPEWLKTASEAELHRNGYQTVKAWDGKNNDPAETTRRNMGMAIAAPVVAAAAAPLLVPLSVREAVIGSAAGGFVNGSFQYATKGEINAVDATVATVTGASTFGKALLPSMTVNAAGAYTGAVINKEDPTVKVGAAVFGTVLGVGAGKLVESKLTEVAVATVIRDVPVVPIVAATATEPMSAVASSVVQESLNTAVDKLTEEKGKKK